MHVCLTYYVHILLVLVDLYDICLYHVILLRITRVKAAV